MKTGDPIKNAVKKALTPQRRFILGRPFSSLRRIARILREKGYDIEETFDDEQAVVLQFFLVMGERYGENWAKFVGEYLEEED